MSEDCLNEIQWQQLMPAEAADLLRPPDLDSSPDPSQEALWLADFIRRRRQAEKEFLIEVGKRSEGLVSEITAWHHLDWVEHETRKDARAMNQMVEDADRLLGELRSVFKNHPPFCWKKPEKPGDLRWNDEVVSAFEVLSEAIRKERGFRVNTGMYQKNRNAFVLFLWPFLKDKGYDQRGASRVLADAFQIAGEESGAFKARAESIRDVIRKEEDRLAR